MMAASASHRCQYRRSAVWLGQQGAAPATRSQRPRRRLGFDDGVFVQYLENLFKFDWVKTKSPAGATRWIPAGQWCRAAPFPI
jgi:hypothetical protein